MRSFTKIMLAAVLFTGSAYNTFANINSMYAKPAHGTDDRKVSGFNGVSVAGSFTVYIKQGSTESVKVDAPDDILSRIITEVNGGVLKIHYNNENWSWNGSSKKVTIYVTAKDLNSISIAGSGDIFFEDGIKTGTLRLSVTGSGDIAGKVDVKTLDSKVTGSGDIKVNGRAGESNVKVTGSGDFEGGDLATVNTAVKVVGSGDAKVNASDKVDAAVAGSGDVHFNRGAKQVNKSKAGSGDISSY
ncbi:MAG: DUF2807 domain-containing protein [Sphingobacteriaceae bacterium]|nr:MAG: DUF2807 domain-containing protein [Sphingobacteriaceae bacterium]